MNYIGIIQVGPVLRAVVVPLNPSCMNIPNDTTFRHAATELVEKILKCKAQADEPNQGQVWVRFTRNEEADAVLVYYDRKNGGCWFCYNGKFFFS